MNKYNITKAQYIIDIGDINSTIKSTINGKELLVPIDPANRHYAAILEWVEDGNTIEDAD
jgi:hypothetical protein